jgi:hypothetical protein
MTSLAGTREFASCRRERPPGSRSAVRRAVPAHTGLWCAAPRPAPTETRRRLPRPRSRRRSSARCKPIPRRRREDLRHRVPLGVAHLDPPTAATESKHPPGSTPSNSSSQVRPPTAPVREVAGSVSPVGTISESSGSRSRTGKPPPIVPEAARAGPNTDGIRTRPEQAHCPSR